MKKRMDTENVGSV